ncbi:MAG: hypothetical protein ACE5HL_12425 [Terriglobia bacterium]
MITEETKFDYFCILLQRELLEAQLGKEEAKVRNWTAEGGYSVGGHFRVWAAADPNLPLCDTLKGHKEPRRYISKAEVRKLYLDWGAYSKGQSSRSAFKKSSVNDTYIIAVFKEFEHLMRAARRIRMAREIAEPKGVW